MDAAHGGLNFVVQVQGWLGDCGVEGRSPPPPTTMSAFFGLYDLSLLSRAFYSS